MISAVDPRAGSQLVYIATTEATTQPGTGPTGQCITAKRIQVYVSADLGVTWSPMAGSNNLPQGQWATDPDIAVGGDGTVYLTLMIGNATPSCATSPNFAPFVAQVWAATPSGPGGTVPGTLQPAFANGNPAVSAGMAVDVTQITASPNRLGQFTLSFVDEPNDQVVTFQRNASGTYDEVFRFTLPSAHSFPNVAMDLNGDLYVTTSDPRALRLTWTGSAWSLVGDGFPPITGTYVQATSMTVDTATGTAFLPGPMLGMTVTRAGSASDHILYLAFEVSVGGVRQIELVAANASNLGVWTPPLLVPLPPDARFSFHPQLSSDPNNNLVDLLVNDIEGPAGAPLSGILLKTFFYRFDASRLSLVLGPTAVTATPPAVANLPGRHSDVQSSLFPGEYIGIATKGLTAIAAYSELQPGTANLDLGRAQISQTCDTAQALIDPDNLWDCTCTCNPDEFSFVQVVGCATAAATTASAACAQICPPRICGGALACRFGACSATSGGQRLSTQSCSVLDGPPRGPAPASAADFRANAGGGSTAVLHVGGETSTTALSGSAFFNVSSSPPTPKSMVEISRLAVTPADVFVGGSVGAMVRNIKLVHPARVRGVLTSANQFRIDPGAAEFILTLQTEPSEGELSSPVNVRASNPTPVFGTLNLASNTFALDGTVADGSGNSLDIHFQGTIVSRPPDSDGDGIIDAVDKCPGSAPGPDRIPPVFTFVPPALTISTCTNVSIGQAIANDPCGVTVTNNAPSRFPLGTTTVTWTARDGAGNTAVATQQVTAVLGDSTSCCPAGSNVIVGTSNNDLINGTAGRDCILGMGGQDTINGGGGDDVISGGDGDDILNGQAGNDRVYGGPGQDVLTGSTGDDFLDGGDGVDQLDGDDGNDTLIGGQGRDILRGGAENDFIDGGPDDDDVFGGDGNDTILGGAGNDNLRGDNGNDFVSGQDGDDTVNGGTGANTVVGGLGHNICIDNGLTLPICEEEGD